MDFTLVLPLICIFAADILFYTTIKNNKLKFKGTNQYRFIVPLIVLAFVISIFMEQNITVENILLIIGLVIFAILGNKCGVSEKGIITGSWFTPWNKLDAISIEVEDDKCNLVYSNKNIKRRLLFKLEDEIQLKKFIQDIKRKNRIK